jgi:hypothetical protein
MRYTFRATFESALKPALVGPLISHDSNTINLGESIMQLLNLKGEIVEDNVEYLADRRNADGTFTVYFDTDEDIAALIRDMPMANGSDEKAVPTYWKEVECRRMGARSCKGTCTDGFCKQSSDGGFTWCKCSGHRPKVT